MSNISTTTMDKKTRVIKKEKSLSRQRALKSIKKDVWLYILLIPGILHFIVFKYAPMWGLLISFQDYNPYLGFRGSPWVGLKHFQDFFSSPDFTRLFKNTLMLSFYNIVFYFPVPIVLALLLNELRKQWFKRTVQTLVYVPHFLSWVIVASITYTLFSTNGPINGIIQSLTGGTIPFLTSVDTFRAMIIGQTMWKETGWGTIIFLAAISNVDIQLYEAAIVDGAGRFRQLWHITLPAIRSTVVVMLILRMGSVLDNGFDQIFLMSNALNRSVSEVFDTYVYTMGITRGAFSYSTAVGLFKSLVGIILIFSANHLAKKFGESGIF